MMPAVAVDRESRLALLRQVATQRAVKRTRPAPKPRRPRVACTCGAKGHTHAKICPKRGSWSKPKVPRKPPTRALEAARLRQEERLGTPEIAKRMGISYRVAAAYLNRARDLGMDVDSMAPVLRKPGRWNVRPTTPPPRAMEALELRRKGMAVDDIAARMGISNGAVVSYLRRALALGFKTGLEGRRVQRSS